MPLQEGEDDLEAHEQRELEAALRLSRETFEQASVSRDGAGGAHDDDEARQLEEAIRLSRMDHEAQFQEDIPTSQVLSPSSSLFHALLFFLSLCLPCCQSSGCSLVFRLPQGPKIASGPTGVQPTTTTVNSIIAVYQSFPRHL